MNKINIEIWSDVVCPFCYIGKRKLEQAIVNFQGENEIKIEWKSYQLDPTFSQNNSGDIYDYLANRYGKERSWSIAMHDNVANQAKLVGLDYHFEKTIPASSFLAHQAAHFAKKNGKGNEFEEILFRAYFTEGKDISDPETLVEIANSLGLDSNELIISLENKIFENAVNNDIFEAQEIGVQGVPFFVFNSKFSISGAQDSQVFLDVLNKISSENEI